MKILVSILSLLPLRALYLLADCLLYPLMYYVVRYRRKLAHANLVKCFPDKTPQEINAIERAFYHHLADLIVEILWAYRATDEQMRERVVFENTSDVEKWAVDTGGCIFLLGHFGNWEWDAFIKQYYTLPDMLHYNVYRRLKNASSDNVMNAIREKLSGEGSGIEKNTLYRHLVRIKAQKKPFSLAMVSDQKPSPVHTHYVTRFLGRQTPFLDGAEVVANKFDWSVAYVRLIEHRRGYYRLRFELITTEPKTLGEHELTEMFVHHLENNILEAPHLWLWTHNRWKYAQE